MLPDLLVKFVYDRRTEAKNEEEAAWRDYNRRCDNADTTRREVEGMKILGFR